MKRTAGTWVLLAALGGCTSMDHNPSPLGCGSCGPRGHAATVPGVQGPWGQPVAMAAPYSAEPPGAAAARAMLARSVPLDIVQTVAHTGPGATGGIQHAAGLPASSTIAPPGVPFQPIVPVHGGGAVSVPNVGNPLGMAGAPRAGACKRTEVRFVSPEGMKVSWYAPSPDGRSGFTPTVIEAPGRYNFMQGAIYRLKISVLRNNVPLDLYPTLEVVPSSAQTDAFLAHSAVPVSFTEEDFGQVTAGNFLVKVIYLPFPQFQDYATTGPDEVVSTRLEPGVDPIAEAHRRGNILLVVRVGNIDLEAANTPPMDAPSPYLPKSGMHGSMPGPGMMPGMHGGMPGMGGPGMLPGSPMRPGGPTLMAPPGTAGGMPGMPPPPALPPVTGGGPAGASTGPVMQRSDPSGVQQVGYKPTQPPARTPAQLASQGTGKSAPAARKPGAATPKPAPKKSWWFGK